MSDNTSHIKGKNQPIEDQMNESWERSVEIMMTLQVLYIIEGVICSLVLIALMLSLYFIWHFDNTQILNIGLIGVGCLIGVLGITLLIGILWQRKMLKEYD